MSILFPHVCKSADYLQNVLLGENILRTAQICVEEIKDIEFDALVCNDGISGMIIAPVMAALANKPLVVVRKGGKITHSGHKVEGDHKDYKRYVLVDDLIHDGDTVRDILAKLHDSYDRPGERKGLSCVAIVLYQENTGYNGDVFDCVKAGCPDHIAYKIPVLKALNKVNEVNVPVWMA